MPMGFFFSVRSTQCTCMCYVTGLASGNEALRGMEPLLSSLSSFEMLDSSNHRMLCNDLNAIPNMSSEHHSFARAI